ncbi:thiamine pyrophosphate-binding protein [Acidianus brierleyi]|uniref:2-oxoacid oxidoreductase (ferredoxin) n=1 Tax=Acidianus brierleyi TaxID=41673 RepID=A0A2U9IBE8_9CREN|nr:thiamine pyrophosphate-binding protein [Acidianus brierleyi]AWR93324.1 thiamine pyrophosphate-binding protein [Acidianus brierleyi]
MKLGYEIYNVIRDFTDRIYGNPGTTELSFLKYLPDDFNYYLALADGIAVGMAEGYYLKTDNLAIVNLHAAPGLSNAAGFIHTAFMDRVPMLIIDGEQSSKYIVDEPRLYGDLKNLPSVKGFFEIKNSHEGLKIINKAIRLSLTPPYGPTVVSIPQDLVDEEVKSIKLNKFSVNQNCSECTLNYVTEKINSSEKVAIVAGYEIDVFNAHEELQKFAEKIGAPIYAEPFASRAPALHIDGTLPRYASQINKILENYDLVLVIGGSLNNVLFPDEEIIGNIIEITYDSLEASKRIWDCFVCNPKSFLINIFNGVKQKNKKSPLISIPNGKNKEIEEAIKTLSLNLKGYTIFEEAPSYRETIREIMGYNKRSFFANRAGFIGWAIPASFGYSSAKGKAFAIVGDGSFNYSFQGLWSATKYGGKMKVLVINNGGYRSLKGWANYNKDFLSPATDPWKLASSYNFESKEFDNQTEAIKWLMEDDSQKLAEIRI